MNNHQEKIDTFNILRAIYTSSEVESEMTKEWSFKLNRLEVSQDNWDAYEDEFNEPKALNDGGYSVAKRMRAVAELLHVRRFGIGIVDEVFRRYRDIMSDRMSKEMVEFINELLENV